MICRRRKAVRRGARWAGVVVAVLTAGACRRPVVLVPGEVTEGELAAEGEAAYQLRLAADAYVRLRVAPQATERVAEVSARVLAPDDRLIAEAAAIRIEAGGVIAWITPAPGTYRLEISNPDVSREVRYRVAVEEARPARREDRDRATAEMAGAEAARRMGPGDRHEALAALKRALDHWRRVGETGPVISTLLGLADLEARSDLDGALALCDEALGLGAGSPTWRIEVLRRRGDLLTERGDYNGGQAAFEEAKALALSEQDLAAAGRVLHDLGSLLRARRSRDLARAAFEEALEYGRRAGDRALQARCHRELAILATLRSEPMAANEEVATALRLAEESGDRQVLASVLHDLGNRERAQGKLLEAREHYQRSLGLNESLGDWDSVVPTLIALGILALDLQRFEEARDYLERALRLAEELELPRWIPDVERELGAAYERMYEYQRAEESYRRSLASAERIGEERLVATALFRLGNLMVQLGRFEEAVGFLSAALVRQQEPNSDPREVPLTLRVLGFAYGQLGERQTAVEHLTEALRLERVQGNAMRTAWTLLALAQVQAEGDPAAARAAVEEAIEITQRVRSGLVVDALRVDFFTRSRSLYDLYIDLLVRSGDLPAAFAASEQGRARALVDLLVEAEVDPRAEMTPDLKGEAQRIDRELARLQSAFATAIADGSAERAERLRDQLAEQRRAEQRLEAKVRQQSRRYRELSAPATQTLEQVKSSLPPGRALLEYWLGAQRSYLFVVTRDGSTVVHLPPERDLRERVERLRTALVGLFPPSRFAAEAHPLYRELVAPALEFAPGAREFVIVPDGALNLLPFEALLAAPPAPGASFHELAYLLHEVEVSYAPSATVLANLRTVSRQSPPTAALRFVAFADPSHRDLPAPVCPERVDERELGGDASIRQLPRLEGARSEAWRIARRYGAAARVFTGSEATEERLASDPEVAAADRLHFAVHGVVCEPRPESSGLVLAPAEDSAEDGILETREIFDLRLAADLVVLSACQTGVGKLVRGEGVVGLARAFFYAGAPSLVVSLWQVPDRPTADLMTSFYARLDEGDSKAAALRRAKLRMVAAGGGTAAPFYWAPFVLLGSRGEADSADVL